MPIVGPEGPRRGIAKPYCLVNHRFEYRHEIAGRGIYDLEDLRCGGLLLECLTRLREQPRVSHRNDRLRGKILQERDLFM